MSRLLFVLLLWLSTGVMAAEAPPAGGGAAEFIPALTVTDTAEGGQQYSVTLQIVMLMTALSFLPALIIMMTSFTRIAVVFAILRQALGMQQTPSNQILIGLTLFLTFFIMAPVFQRANEQALTPYMDNQISATEAFDRAKAPFHSFMLAQTRRTDLDLFLRLSKTEITSAEEAPFWVVVPAFVTSELKTAFQIGFMLFIPFLIIDLVVASVLMAMGMMMLSPLVISLPFKLMLFVLVDGWTLIIGTLANSFRVV